VNYDAIIVGAGPAGSFLAKKLAEAGLKVLLVERKAHYRHKMCSGLVSSFARRVLKKEVGEVPPVLCCYPQKIKGIQVYPVKGAQPEKFRESSQNVWRNDFDFWLTTKASEAGAEVLDQTEFLNFSETRDAIQVNLKGYFGTQQHESQFLIGADGGTSLIRRTLYKQEPIKWFHVYQTYWKGAVDLDAEYFHAFLDREFTEFFAWSNIKMGHKGLYQIVGTAAAKGNILPHYFSRFQEYLEEAHGFRGEKLLFREACIAPVFFDPKFEYKFGKNNVFIIGEAAGLFNVFAEGISPALTSALNAADAILQGGSEVLQQYQKNIQPLCSSLRIGWESLLKMFPKFLSQD
jgi:flavin-dependent dehydrogenase